MPRFPIIKLLNVRIDIVTWADLINMVSLHINKKEPLCLSYANAHTLNLAAQHPKIGQLLNASDITYCDGNGVRLAGRINGVDIPERHTGADWIWKLAQEAEKQNWSIFWLGNAPGLTDLAAKRLQQHFPKLHIETAHGFHKKTGQENDAIIARINAADCDILLVGMGTPTQEQWIQSNKRNIKTPVLWALGAAAEFVAQPRTRPGPDWLITHLEWVSRLWANPRRLWKRYLIGNPAFLFRITLERIQKE